MFRRLGAEGQALELVGQYMRIWYFGAVFRSVQWMGSGVLISTGDSKAASRLMILGTVLNVILDPIMIFGWAGWPAMGIRGAALATVISQGVATGWLLQLLGRKHGLLVWETWGLRDYAGSVRANHAVCDTGGIEHDIDADLRNGDNQTAQWVWV